MTVAILTVSLLEDNRFGEKIILEGNIMAGILVLWNI